MPNEMHGVIIMGSRQQTATGLATCASFINAHSLNILMLKAAVFDLDGVLVDTEDIHFRGWQEALRANSILLTREEYFQYAGRRGDEIEHMLIKVHHLAAPSGTILQRKTEWMGRWLRANAIPLMPYAKEAVNCFIAKGIPVAVASGGTPEEVELKLRKTGLRDFFHTVVSGNDVKNGKPHPEMYRRVAASLGVATDRCVAFEDTQYGVEAARNAGMQCIAIPTPFSSAQDFTRANAVCSDMEAAIKFCADRWKEAPP
jgi:beta-phosphoglucomutase-like phosphatase (HAD superfamily)